MPNLGAVLKSEISRLARRELRGEVEALRKTVSTHRSEIARLKRQVQALEKTVRSQSKLAKASTLSSASDTAQGTAKSLRFSAKGLASHRAKLGLSAADYARLVGTTGQSIYAWEQGKSTPRSATLAAIAELRGLGKRAIAQRLATLE